MTRDGVLPFGAPGASDPLTVGGKAATLSRLRGAGLPVPDGVVIPPGTSDLTEVTAAISQRFTGRPLAVRSSAVAEDLEDASFAGQYDTVLGVAPEPKPLREAIERVRTSVAAAHVETYGPGHDRRMAVLVMPMLEPEAAGIAFTRNPVTGARETVIEAVPGLGDRLAAGEVAGERWTVASTTTCSNDLGVLLPHDAEAVERLAADVEAVEGQPQDIEWALVAGEVLLLQARPITTVDNIDPIPITDPPPPGPWEWDSTHSRDPMTTLTSSIFTRSFTTASHRLVEEFGAPIKELRMRSIGGYLYIQVAPPMGEPGRAAPPPWLLRLLYRVVPSLRRRERTAARALAGDRAAELAREWRTTIRPRVTATLAGWRDEPPTDLDDDRLLERLLAAVDLQGEVFGWNMVTDPSYLLPLADLHRFLHRELGEPFGTAVHLMAGTGTAGYGESHGRVQTAMSERSRAAILAGAGPEQLGELDPHLAAVFAAHMAEEGGRVLGFDLEHPTIGENPHAELVRIANASNRPTPTAPDTAGELRERLPAGLHPDFDSLLRQARETHPIREDGEDAHARAVGAIRSAALEVGERMAKAGLLEEPGHVLHLTLAEATGWPGSSRDLRGIVAHRRGQRAWARAQTPTPAIGDGQQIPDPASFPPATRRFTEVFQLLMEHDARPPELEDGIDGVAASAGTHTGPVRIVIGPEDFDKVAPGDVLIAPITTSAWEVLFDRIGALVTEGGGLLSHPAIIAREYGLPAVVGCEGATARFRDGQLVSVDGAKGTVTPLDKETAR